MAGILTRVPEKPAASFHEALQSYWLVYILVTLEMGGCCPGGGLGLGRMDQYLYPYYRRDIEAGRLTRDRALELMELFLLCFRHVDYYTPHQLYTPGSQASLGGVTPTGLDASNELTELIMEASLRIAMPAPYISLRLHRQAPERYWRAAAGCWPLAAPKWGNGDDRVDDLAERVTGVLYEEFSGLRNPRGGPWQLALYSFVANHGLGRVVGASADGREAGASLTRNLNPAWGTDRQGPTAVLESLSRIDFTHFPNGCSLDLRFDPALFESRAGRGMFAGFLKGFVDLGVMQMQISMVDTQTLIDAREHPERWPNLMVKVAGYSARFVDLSDEEKEEVINRTAQRLAG